jgi:hypothetical protein
MLSSQRILRVSTAGIFDIVASDDNQGAWLLRHALRFAGVRHATFQESP